MKVLKTLLAIFALLCVVGCEPEPQQPAEQPTKMEFKITSSNPMVVSAEGGDYTIDYVITAPDETLTVTAVKEGEVDWIRINAVADNCVRMAVAANESEKSRSATIVVSYDRDYKVVVSQAGKKPEPKEILSTLTNDVDMVLDEDNSLVYADYYGEDYGDGRGMWQFWFLDVIDKRMLCIEVLCDSQGSVPVEELYVPTGEFATSDDPYAYVIMMPGYRISDMDGLYDGGSWYTQLETSLQSYAAGPIAEGVMNVTDAGNGDYYITYNVKDDVGNTITGSYTGAVIIEDFRK